MDNKIPHGPTTQNNLKNNTKNHRLRTVSCRQVQWPNLGESLMLIYMPRNCREKDLENKVPWWQGSQYIEKLIYILTQYQFYCDLPSIQFVNLIPVLTSLYVPLSQNSEFPLFKVPSITAFLFTRMKSPAHDLINVYILCINEELVRFSGINGSCFKSPDSNLRKLPLVRRKEAIYFDGFINIMNSKCNTLRH